MYHNGVVVRISKFTSSGLGLLPRRGKYDLLLNVWYSESFVKEKQTPHFIFVVWSALVVGGCLMAAWGRKSYLGPAEISSVVCTWLNSRMGDAGWFVCIASAKSWSAMRGSHQPAFMESPLTIIHMCLPCLPSRWELILICSVPLPPIAGIVLGPLTFSKDKIMLHCSPQMKCQQSFTTEIGY